MRSDHLGYFTSMLELDQEPLVTEILGGNMGNTFKINLDRSDQKNGVFYVKFSDKSKNSRIFDHASSEEDFIDKIFEREFLLLELLNLLGMKTPTEFALMKYDGGSIIVKRAAGDGEFRDEVSSMDYIDKSYNNRLQILVDVLGIEDANAERNNVITVVGREMFFRKLRNVLIDPMLGAKAIYSSKDMFDFTEKTDRQFQEILPDLQKITYFYRENEEAITSILDKLDIHFDNVLHERGKVMAFRGVDRDLMKQCEGYPRNLTSRLRQLIDEIENRSERSGVSPYVPNPRGEYIARRITPILDEETLKYILHYVKNEESIRGFLPEEFEANVRIYSASKAESFYCEIQGNLGEIPKVTFRDKIRSIEPRPRALSESESCCLIS